MNGYMLYILLVYVNVIVFVCGIVCCIVGIKGVNIFYLVNIYGIWFDVCNNDYLIFRVDGSIVVGGVR